MSASTLINIHAAGIILLVIACGFIVAIGLAFSLLWLANTPRRRKVARLRAEGLYPDKGSETDADVIRLTNAGEREMAAECYRKLHKCNLAQARIAVGISPERWNRKMKFLGGFIVLLVLANMIMTGNLATNYAAWFPIIIAFVIVWKREPVLKKMAEDNRILLETGTVPPPPNLQIPLKDMRKET